jgi:hypothetical protein
MSLEIPMQKVFFDFYTTSHPYAPLGVGNLADEIGVLHKSSFVLYSKTKTLGSLILTLAMNCI